VFLFHSFAESLMQVKYTIWGESPMLFWSTMYVWIFIFLTFISTSSFKLCFQSILLQNTWCKWNIAHGVIL